MQPYGLPHTCRLHLKRDFEHIIASGTKSKYNGVVLWYRRGENTLPARFAVVVSRRLGTAVVRNRTKRLLREAFRLIRKNVVSGADVIVSPRDCTRLSNLHAAQQTLKTLLVQASLLSSSSKEIKIEEL